MTWKASNNKSNDQFRAENIESFWKSLKNETGKTIADSIKTAYNKP